MLQAPSLIDQPGTLRPVMRLALPVLAEQLLFMLVGFTDTWLTGNYLVGDEYLAAMNLIAYLLWLLSSLLSVVSIGATAVVARFIGASDRRSASHAAGQSLLLGLVLAVAIVVAGWILAAPFVQALQLETDAAELAVAYLRILLPVLPLMMLQQVGFACFRGAGDTVVGLIVMTLVNAVNLLVSASLVIGWGPWPQLGWQGLAIGTAAGYCIGGMVVLGLLVRGRAGLRLGRHEFKPHWPLMRRLLRVGLPGGFDSASITVCQLWFVSIINQLGNLQAAAHGVAIRIEALGYLPGTAFAVAAATLTGQFLGAGNPRRAAHSVLVTTAAGVAVMSLAGLLYFVAAAELAGFFVGSEQTEVAELAAPLLRLIAFAMPALAIIMVLTGALRGAGDTRWPLIVTFVGYLVLRIPLAYFLAMDRFELPLLGTTLTGLGLGIRGAWYAMLIDLHVRAAIVVARFLGGRWKHVEV